MNPEECGMTMGAGGTTEIGTTVAVLARLPRTLIDTFPVRMSGLPLSLRIPFRTR
jgi:hypothetical protein